MLYTVLPFLKRERRSEEQEMGNNGKTYASSKLRKAAKKILSFCSSDTATLPTPCNVGQSREEKLCSPASEALNSMSEICEEGEYTATVSCKNVCTICLEPLLNSNKAASSPGKAIFTSQCCHSFHLSCISSNISHGSITCPVCRARWTRLPRSLRSPHWLSRNQDDPVLGILDDSISTFRAHRRSFLHTARYNDDDPLEPEAHSACHPRLCFRLTPVDVLPTPSPSNIWSSAHHSSPNPYISLVHSPHEYLSGSISMSPWCKGKRATYLSVKLAPQQAIDLVLVASPNGPHLRLLKQSISQVLYSLRSIDRLAIVGYSSAASRIFSLRRMTSYGKRAALQVIDRLIYAGHAHPVEGIRKGIKILKDRAHENPYSCILHLSDYPTCNRYHRSINDMEMTTPWAISVHHFHVASTSSIMHELQEFLGRLLGGVIQEVQLRIGDQEDARFVRLGELRGDEERKVLLEVDEAHDDACIGYSYVEGGLRVDERVRVGEVMVAGVDDFTESEGGIARGSTSCVDSWDYHDPYMARRWAKRLHGRHRV